MARKTELKSDPKTTYELILENESKYQIPKFQRSYCWEKSNIEMLWDDIDSLFSTNETKRFLGAIIVREFSTPGNRQNYMLYDVIDGQQRLTTLWMFLAVLTHTAWHEAKKIIEAGSDSETIKACDELKKASIWIAERLFDRDMSPKIIPSFSDRKEFNWALDYIDFLSEEKKPQRYPNATNKKAGKLETAVHSIDELMTERLNSKKTSTERAEYLSNLITNVRDRLQFIKVILADYHDPNEVFDRLNIAGQELTVLDMVRNEIFKIFGEDDNKAYDFYENEWKSLENDFEKPFDDARPNEDDEDHENYKKSLERFSKLLSSHKNNFWYPYALTKNPDASGQKKQLFDGLKIYWSKMPFKNTTEKARNILNDIKRYVPIYNAVTYGIKPNGLSIKSDLWGKISRIHQYGIQSGAHSYLYQLILEGLETQDKDKLKNICDCLDLVESYTLRRAFCKDDGSVKNVFNPAWDIVRSDPQLLNYQLDDLSRPFYTDEQVIDSLTKGAGLNFYSLKDRALFCLVEYENDLDGDNLEYEKFTIDHIMPQKFKNNWGHISDDEHNQYKDSWGNLVPLTKSINAKKSNRSWEETQLIYKDKSATKTPREISSKKTWGIKDITQRNETLAKWAIKKWRKPELKKTKEEYERELTKKLDEKANNISSELQHKGLDLIIFKITHTGYKKSNLTCTKTISTYLAKHNFHNFDRQISGESNKEIKEIIFVHEGWLSRHAISLYKTAAKDEQRFWPNGLNEYCTPLSILALWMHDNDLFLINCSNEAIFNYVSNEGFGIANLQRN